MDPATPKSPKEPLGESQSRPGPLSAKQGKKSGSETETKTLPRHCIICAVPNSSDVSVNQKIVTYFLKRLLKYQLLSNSQITTLLLKYNLVHFCAECEAQLSSSYSIHLEIIELESKLALIRSIIEDKILSTINSDGIDFWGQQVRRRVREESSTITPEFDLDLEEVSQGLQEDDKEQEEDKVQDLLDLDDYFDDNQVHGEQEEEEIVIIEAPSGSKSTPKITLVPKIRQNRASNSFVTSMIKCPMCSTKVATQSALSTHIARNHKQTLNKGKFVCLVCSMSFSRSDYFNVHTSCHSDYPLTGNGVPVSDSQNPIELSSDSSRAGLEDSDLDFAPPTRQNNKRGPKKTNKLPKLSKTCPLCPLTFEFYHNMIRHLNKGHKDAAMFSCQFESCERKFLREDYLASHRRLEHGDTSTSPDPAVDFAQEKLSERTCHVCWKVFDRPSDMKNHHKSVHLEFDKTFICEICAKPFKRYENLKQHLEYHETGSKIFNCDHDQCGKSFRRKRDMLVHQRLHTGVRSLLCSLCGQSFRHESSLRRHNILRHGLKPSKNYDCETCGKKFLIKWHLVQHLQSKSHGGAGLKKRVRKHKTNGEDTRTRKRFERLDSPSNGSEEENPIDLVSEERNNEGTIQIPVARPSQYRFFNNFENPAHPTQQPQNNNWSS